MYPKKQKIRTSLLVLAFVLLGVPVQPVFADANNPFPATQSVSSEIEFALTGTATGWLRSGDLLFRTESNGTEWQDVTPALNPGEVLVDAYFMNSSRAFALTVSANSERWQLNLLKTNDFGFSWQAQAVTLPKTEGDFLKVPFGNAFLQWQNDKNGWILIKQATSSNFSLGIMLITNDSGRSWAVSKPPAAEEFVFLDEKLGFMRDPVNPTRLYQTKDSGKNWQGFQPLIEQTAGIELQRVGLPTKWQGGEVVIPAWIKGKETESEFDFLRLQDGAPSQTGETFWMKDPGVINPQSWQEPFGSAPAFTQLSSFDGENFWLGLTDGSCKQDTLADEASLPPSTLTCETKHLLLSSQDGGEHWEVINLPYEAFLATLSSSQEVMFQNMLDIDQELNTSQWVQIYQGQGFDACEIPSLSNLQAWYNGSPYKAVNLYIGGVSRACDNDALNAAYVQQMFNQGWRFIPTWVGPQAPCTGFVNRFSYDTATAYAQGVDNANQARDTLLELGLTNPDGTGSIVYYDLEYFTYSTACSAAARAFVQGWIDRLQQLGIISGLYASSRNLDLNQIYTLQPPPNVVWIAEWYTTPGYRPDVTVWDVDWLEDIYWSNHQRVYQYSGDHNETWAGVTINIDNNVLDGIVAVPSDSTAPVTNYEESGTMGISPWYKTEVTVNLTATDNLVGVKNTYYKINAGNWQTYTTPFALSGSGEMTIDYRSVDLNDNWETMKTASFYVDSEPPINPQVTNPGCQAWNGVPQAWCNDPNFTWAGAYDPGVGLNPSETYEVYWGTDYGAASGTRTSATQLNPPAIPTGVPYYLRIRTQDKHGLWSAWQTIYTLIYDYRFTHQVWLPEVAK